MNSCGLIEMLGIVNSPSPSVIFQSVMLTEEVPLLNNSIHSESVSETPFGKNSLINISALTKPAIETNIKTNRNPNNPCFTALFFNLLPQRKESDEKI